MTNLNMRHTTNALNSVLGMSKVAEKNGLSIYIVTRFGKHKAPYLKAMRAGESASYTIKDGKLQIGGLSNVKDQELVQFYIKEKREELLAAFDKALQGIDPGKIPFPVKKKQVKATWKAAPKLLKIQAIKPLTLRGNFADGKIIEWNLSKVLPSGDLAQELKNFNLFSKVKTNGELISWPNGLDIEAIDLYELGIELKKVS